MAIVGIHASAGSGTGLNGQVKPIADRSTIRAHKYVVAALPQILGCHPWRTQQSPTMIPHDAMVSEYDPFLTTASMSTQGDLTGGGFADFFREMFGPGFGGVF